MSGRFPDQTLRILLWNAETKQLKSNMVYQDPSRPKGSLEKKVLAMLSNRSSP